MKIRRISLFSDSYQAIKCLSTSDLQKKFLISFDQEEGIDAGGITKEWFLLLSKEIFNANYALFIQGPKGINFQPDANSHINAEHLNYLKFAGRIIGKALFEGYLTNCYFTRSFYKQILGQKLKMKDIQDIDPEFYENLKWILDNKIEGMLFQEFCFLRKFLDFYQIIDLIPNGSNIEVNDENKREYVRLLCLNIMEDGIKPQIQSFIEGFYELIPKDLVKFFDFQELELMLTGLSEINLEDLKANTEYHEYSANSEIIRWFWELLSDFNSNEKAGFLQFVTGFR